MSESKQGGGGVNLRRNMVELDWIEKLFVVYSLAHNTLNAWTYAHSAVFFLFVLVGIVSVELIIHTVYKYWKWGRLIGGMKTAGIVSGIFAMFYATAGIIAHAQAGGDSGFLAFYYQWILPTSAPAMFIAAFIIQSIDPILAEEQEVAAFDIKTELHGRRVALVAKKMALDYKDRILGMKEKFQAKRLDSISREGDSRRVKKTLEDGARAEVPRILIEMGVDVRDKGKLLRGTQKLKDWFSFSSAGYSPDDLRLVKKKAEAEDATYSDIPEERPGK